MITEEAVNKAFEDEFDGIEPCLLVREILALREKHRWIPVTPETMPENKKKFWILGLSRCEALHAFKYRGVSQDAEFLKLHFTHWMPIPTLPEVKNDD